MSKHFGDRILEDFMFAGRSADEGVTVDDVDRAQLEEGINVEVEHSVDPVINMKISLDHLAEHESYYTGLSLMEQIIEHGLLGEFKDFALMEFGIRPKLRKITPALRRRLGL